MDGGFVRCSIRWVGGVWCKEGQVYSSVMESGDWRADYFWQVWVRPFVISENSCFQVFIQILAAQITLLDDGRKTLTKIPLSDTGTVTQFYIYKLDKDRNWLYDDQLCPGLPLPRDQAHHLASIDRLRDISVKSLLKEDHPILGSLQSLTI